VVLLENVPVVHTFKSAAFSLALGAVVDDVDGIARPSPVQRFGGAFDPLALRTLEPPPLSI
jgi:hypothetical protein